MSEDAGVQAAIAEAFGPEVVRPSGEIDRVRLREIVFADREARLQLEAIVHPVIRVQWLAQAKAARSSKEWLVLDIPLLYEIGGERECDAVAVVACRVETQRHRMITARGLDDAMATRILAAQQSLEEKVARAPHVIWSEVSLEMLEQQAAVLAAYLQERYG